MRGRVRQYSPCPGKKQHAFINGRCCYCKIGQDAARCAVSNETKLRGTSQFDTRWTPPDILAVSAQWNRVTQARDFFRLVQNGKCTLEEAERDIRMSEKQRDLLLKNCIPTEVRGIEAVFRGREQTWEAFLLLCAGESLEEEVCAE